MTAPIRVLLFGGGGQVGTELQRRRWPMPVRLIVPNRAEADFSNPSGLGAVVAGAEPDLIVNAAAYTAVDRAESEPELAHIVNAAAPAALAQAAALRSLPIIHISTDYVFDGVKPSAYVEDDPIHPLSVYGASKAAGEAGVREAGERHIILRTSWVFGASGANFVRTMLRLGADRSELRVVDNQWGAPTSAADIADAIGTVAARVLGGEERFGIFHFTNAGATTWRRFAERIFAEVAAAGGPRPRVAPISAAEYPTPARRPANSRLDCSRIESAFGITRRPWEAALADVLVELAPVPNLQQASVS